MKVKKALWPAVTIRIFAVLNLLLGLEGLAALLHSLTNGLVYDPWSQDPLYYAQAYYFRSAINLVFVVFTILGGLYLWRVDRRGWTVCKVLFIGEIAYFFLGWFDFVFYWVLGEQARAVRMALAASAGTGNMGTVLQTITGYPVIALIGLKIAYSKLPCGQNAPAGPTAPTTPGPVNGSRSGWRATTVQAWPRIVIRIFAVLNLCFGLVGLLLLIASQYAPLRVISAWDQHSAYFAKAYYFQVAFNLVFVLTVIWTAFPLWRLRQLGKMICNVLFCAEIAYIWFAVLALAALLNVKPSALLEFGLESAGPGNVGIALQLLCGYPLIALVAINVAYHRLNA
jgi:hypothetical protein